MLKISATETVTRHVRYPTVRQLLCLFSALSFIFFAAPLVQKAYVLTALDAGFMFIGFLAVMLLESALLVLVLRLVRIWPIQPVITSIVASGLMALNVFHFFFVVSNSAPSTLIIIVTLCSAVLLTGFWSFKANEFLLKLCCVMVLVMCFTEWGLQLQTTPKDHATNLDVSNTDRAQKSVYVIAFDALASRQALQALYGISKPEHTEYLEKAGFQIYDTLSPGHDTIDSFVEWFSMGTAHTSRNSKHFFNGSTVTPLYSLLREKRFKIQFIYHSNLFGVNAGRIDSFYPQQNTVSICEFVDRRYGFGICGDYAFNAFWKPLLGKLNHDALLVASKSEGGYQFVADRLAFAKDAHSPKWFSVSYIWFPGHAGFFPTDDENAKQIFSQTMGAKLPQLIEQFDHLKQKILQHDPQAAIVIVGDHGGWSTGHWALGTPSAPSNATQDLLELDRRSVLLAVYPQDFCRQQLIDNSQTPALLLKKLASCASTSN